MSMPKSIQIVYFPLRARAEAARMILEYGNINYVDKSVAQYFGKSWEEAKPEAPFGQLPLLNVDGEVFAHSGVIVRYCASLVPNLVPSDAVARAKCDAVFEASQEFVSAGSPCNVNPLVNIFKGEDWASKKAAYFELAAPKLQNLERSFGDGPFFFGAQPLYCDFGVYHVLSNTRLLEPGCLSEYPKLSEFMGAVEGLPRIKEYLDVRPKPVDIGTAPKLDPPIVGSRYAE